MRRGSISSEGLRVAVIDYRVLFSQRQSDGWFCDFIENRLLKSRYEGSISAALRWEKGAKKWLKDTWGDSRIIVFSIGKEMLERAIEFQVGDFSSECYHFKDAQDFRQWCRVYTGVFQVITRDPQLLELDSKFTSLCF